MACPRNPCNCVIWRPLQLVRVCVDIFLVLSGTASNLIINGPASALPHDILRAFKEGKVVHPGFSVRRSEYLCRKELSATHTLRYFLLCAQALTYYLVTALPIGAVRRPSMFKSFHITTDDAKMAKDMWEILNARPLFVGCTGVPPLVRSGRPDYVFSSDANEDGSFVTFCDVSAMEWTTQLLRKARARDTYRTKDDPRLTAEWALQPSMSGHRVVVRGLPGTLQAYEVVPLAQDSGGVDPIRLPTAPYTPSSAWAITFKSVAEAYAFQRRTHLRPFVGSNGRDYTMRSQVMW